MSGPRVRAVALADAALEATLDRFQATRDLTDVEMLIVLTRRQEAILKRRAGRDRDDPDRKADEE